MLELATRPKGGLNILPNQSRTLVTFIVQTSNRLRGGLIVDLRYFTAKLPFALKRDMKRSERPASARITWTRDKTRLILVA